MSNWFKKDIKIKIISILLAVFLWLYVLNVSDPLMSKTIYNIPVTIVNEDYLEQNDYILTGTVRSYIDVTIRGRKSAVEKVTPADFETTLDFSQVNSVSDKKLALSEPVCLQKDVTVESYSPTSIDVQLERNKSGTFTVELESNITMKPGYVLINTTVSPETIPILDKESTINSIGSIKAKLELKDLDRDTVKQVQCTVYNKSGKEIAKFKDFKVTVKAEVAKEVPVSLVTRGRLAADYVETLRVIKPEKVLVTGPAEVLEGITEIKTEQVDIEKISGNFTASVPVVVPENAKLVDSVKEVSVNINVEKLVVRNIEISGSDVSILNARNDGTLVYEITSDNLLLQFKGRQAETDAIRIDSLKPAVDVSELGEGNHRLALNINTPGQAKLVQRVYADVKISKPPVEEPNTTENGGTTPQ